MDDRYDISVDVGVGKELGASDLDVHVCQNDVKPIVNFDIKI